ncbi:hypothetical protein TIFTF001_053181 [Ficus carica]|uniref:Uncharacterized protein n=1 Tax=Ficus carica TaxID=3494 RepID=A0AA88JJ18_FICCA|nr:hypothetical protein TIFTF001_053181 [Ficus carica]
MTDQYHGGYRMVGVAISAAEYDALKLANDVNDKNFNALSED